MEVIKIPKIEGRIDRVTGQVINRKLRVAGYARVSSMIKQNMRMQEECQLNRYEIIRKI